MTRRLFDENPYLRACTSTVRACEPAAEGYLVELDETCFYPEGGGQPGDRGTLGGVRVLDTREEAGRILHVTEGPLPVGETVRGEIDWARRFDLMQQHSGEHMVSGVVHSLFGYDNVGFHMGAETITIDFSGPLTEEDLRRVEEIVCEKITLDLPVRCWVPAPEELSSLPYRSKKALTGDVRLVEFPDTDLCACCGTHVARTGEIGLVKLLSLEKFHGGARVEMVSGGRALQWLRTVTEQNRQISRLLSAKMPETAEAVRNLSAELERQKRQVYALEAAWFRDKAESLRGAGDVYLRLAGLSPDGLRRAAAEILETCGGRAAVFTGDEETGYRYAIGQKDGDLRDFTKALNAALRGRGGGKPGFVQGSVQAAWGEIEDFFRGISNS